jgi:hypothetical protein
VRDFRFLTPDSKLGPRVLPKLLNIQAMNLDFSLCDPVQGRQLADQGSGTPLAFLALQNFALCFPYSIPGGDYNVVATPGAKKQQLAINNFRRIQ